jgi:F-type H+-transporting ATPase subunit c
MLGLGLGLAALGVGIGLGLIGYGAMTGMSRQPEAIGRLQTAMLIALAFVELVFLLTVFVAPTSFRENVTVVRSEGGATTGAEAGH